MVWPVTAERTSDGALHIGGVAVADLAAEYGTPLYLEGANMGKPIYPGGLGTLADLDNDGYPEIVTGREAWKVSWVAGNPPMVSLMQKWKDTVVGKLEDEWETLVQDGKWLKSRREQLDAKPAEVVARAAPGCTATRGAGERAARFVGLWPA